MSRWKKVLLAITGLFAVIAVGLFLLITVTSEALPTGTPGKKAEELAANMLAAVNQPAWDSIRAVSWNFAGKHHLLWDKKRNYAQVSWEKYVVQLEVNQQKGLVWYKGKPLTRQEDRNQKVEMAWRFWINDSFWLNPVVKVNDPGTERKLVTLEDGKEALLVTYTSGGSTPGDSYLWITDENYLPTSWKLWVSIVPIGGFEFSWEDWKTTENGAKICTFHKSALLDISINELQTYPTLQDLTKNGDPFGPLEDFLINNGEQ